MPLYQLVIQKIFVVPHDTQKIAWTRNSSVLIDKET